MNIAPNREKLMELLDSGFLNAEFLARELLCRMSDDDCKELINELDLDGDNE